MMLRPHHLLCTQGYSGKGYSDAFVQNMTAITNRLRNEVDVVVNIIFSTDDICAKCPKMIDTGLCKDNDKVESFDKKLIDYFDLEEKSYIYQDIIREIDSKMTETIMEDICSNCCWYPVSACKSKILANTNKSDCGK